MALILCAICLDSGRIINILGVFSLYKSIITFFVVLFYSSLAFAESDLRLAVVDLQQALAESNAGKKAQEEYKRDVLEAQKNIDVKKKEFEKKREDLKSQKDSLNEKALLAKSEELMSVERDLQRSFKDSQDMLQRKNATIVNELVKNIREVIDSIGKEQKLSLILEKGSQALLFSAGAKDITSEVVEKFNARR